jgi:hypothetical protein
VLCEAAKQVPEVYPALAWGQVVLVVPVAVGEPHLLTAGYPQLVQEPIDAFWDQVGMVDGKRPAEGVSQVWMRCEMNHLNSWRLNT